MSCYTVHSLSHVVFQLLMAPYDVGAFPFRTSSWTESDLSANPESFAQFLSFPPNFHLVIEFGAIKCQGLCSKEENWGFCTWVFCENVKKHVFLCKDSDPIHKTLLDHFLHNWDSSPMECSLPYVLCRQPSCQFPSDLLCMWNIYFLSVLLLFSVWHWKNLSRTLLTHQSCYSGAA